MWRKSLLSLLLESLSFVFSLSRKRNSAIRPTNAAVSEMCLPSHLLKNERSDKLFYFPSIYLKGEVALGTNSVFLLWVALQEGNLLCETFGIAPEAFTRVLRNAGYSVHPRQSESNSPVSITK